MQTESELLPPRGRVLENTWTRAPGGTFGVHRAMTEQTPRVRGYGTRTWPQSGPRHCVADFAQLGVDYSETQEQDSFPSRAYQARRNPKGGHDLGGETRARNKPNTHCWVCNKNKAHCWVKRGTCQVQHRASLLSQPGIRQVADRPPSPRRPVRTP